MNNEIQNRSVNAISNKIDRIYIPGYTEPFYFTDLDLAKQVNSLDADIYDKIYPVGSLFWTSKKPDNDDGNPNKKFYPTRWALITGNFVLMAANDGDKVTPVTEELVTNNRVDCSKLSPGKSILSSNYGINNIKITPQHLPPHTHDIHDPGHEHKLQTYGDDYQENTGKGASGGPNFVRDGNSNMADSNWSKGLKAVKALTGITGTRSTGDNKEIDITPYNIKRYCWERIE